MNGNGNGTNGNGATSVLSSDRMPGRNGGQLRRGGGNPKRTGGHAPSKLREAMRLALKPRIKIAQQIADDPTSTPADRMRALDFLGKYGLGTTVTETDTEGNDVQIRVLREPRRLHVDD